MNFMKNMEGMENTKGKRQRGEGKCKRSQKGEACDWRDGRKC